MLPEADAPPTDEELTGTSRRPWLGLGLLAVALIAGLLAARFAERHDATPRAKASAPHAGVPHRGTDPLSLEDQRDCPAAGDGQTICTTSPRVPAAVFAAVRARFPHAQKVDAIEERLRDIGYGPGGVWYRSLSAVDGQRSIVVVVRRRTSDDTAAFTSASGAGLIDRLQDTRLVGRRAVIVAVIGPHGQLPSSGVVRALARDPRLLTASGT